MVILLPDSRLQGLRQMLVCISGAFGVAAAVAVHILFAKAAFCSYLIIECKNTHRYIIYQCVYTIFYLLCIYIYTDILNKTYIIYSDQTAGWSPQIVVARKGNPTQNARNSS